MTLRYSTDLKSTLDDEVEVMLDRGTFDTQLAKSGSMCYVAQIHVFMLGEAQIGSLRHLRVNMTYSHSGCRPLQRNYNQASASGGFRNLPQISSTGGRC